MTDERERDSLDAALDSFKAAMKWSEDATPDEKALVYGNLLGFVEHLRVRIAAAALRAVVEEGGVEVKEVPPPVPPMPEPDFRRAGYALDALDRAAATPEGEREEDIANYLQVRRTLLVAERMLDALPSRAREHLAEKVRSRTWTAE